MKRIILYIAASLDGYIAESDGSTEFLSCYPITDKINYGYKEFLSSVDTLIMGGRTYRELWSMDALWPYADKMTYVISRNDWGESVNIRFITDNVIEAVKALRREPGKDIWLYGGGRTVSMLMQAGLIDEMRIFYIPVLLGKGTALFTEQPTRSNWVLTGNETYCNGVLGIIYEKNRDEFV